jgi:hypothetical protein
MTKYLVGRAGVFEVAADKLLRERSENGGSSTMFTAPRDSEMSCAVVLSTGENEVCNAALTLTLR